MTNDESMLLLMHQEAIIGRKEITQAMQGDALPRSGGYHIFGFTYMVDVSFC
jgi:hypothetical protein